MTFETVPPDYSGVNNSLIYVVYDANSIDPTKTNYKYVAELWVDGVYKFTSKKFPNPTNNRGIFDFSKVAREFILPTLKIDGNFTLAQNEFYNKFQVKIREEYNGTVGAIVASSSEVNYFNHYNGRISNFTNFADYANKPLTNRPTTVTIPEDATLFFLPYFNDGASFFVEDLNGRQYTDATTNIAAHVINVAGYVGKSQFVQGDNYYEYKINYECAGKYDNYVIHFLNKQGAYESFAFNKVSNKSFAIERKQYQQQAYKVDGSGIATIKQNNIVYRGTTNYVNNFDETLQLFSELLTDAEYVWLSELVFSPDVYIQKVGEADIYPCVITDTDYKVKTYLVDELQPLNITVKFNGSQLTQLT